MSPTTTEHPGADEHGLTEVEVKMLDFERTWWKHAGAKETEVRRRWGISSTIYYMRLNALIDNPAALAHDPLLVHRLLRLRANRQSQRSARRSS